MIKFASSASVVPSPPKPGLRFTSRGKLFLFATLVAALAAYLLNHNLIMLASAMLLAIPIYQWLFLKLAMGRSEIQITWPELLFNKRSSYLQVEITRKALLSLPSATLRIVLTENKPIVQSLEDLPAKTTTAIDIPFTPKQRGMLVSRDWFFSSSAPFGLLQITQGQQWQQQKIVFPELLGQLPPSLQSVADQKGPLPKQSSDFQYLDTYRAGDDVRLIHWRKSTLNEAPVIRRDQTREDTLPSLTLVADATPYFEHAVKALATFFHNQQNMRTWYVLEPQGLREIRDRLEMLAYLALVTPLESQVVASQQQNLKQPLFFSKIFSQQSQRKTDTTSKLKS